MDQIWLASPCPAMRLWPGRPTARWRLNPAALSLGRGLALNEAAWEAVAAELSAAHLGGSAREGRLAVVGARWRSLPMNTGWLVWLIADAKEGSSGRVSLADRLEMAQDIGHIGLFEFDLKTGAAHWDAQTFRLLGFDPAEGVPSWQRIIQRVHPEDVGHLRAEHHRCLDETGRRSLRWRLTLPDGEQRDLQIVAEVRRDADGQPTTMLGAVSDETESAGRVRAQEAVSEQFAKALRLARIGVWRIDLEQRWIELNDVGYDMLGLTPAAGGLPIDLIRAQAHPDDVEGLANAAAEALASDAVVDLETRYVGPGPGGYRRVLTRRVAERDAEGRAIGLLGVSLEQTERITERDRAQALARRIEMVADIAGVGVYSVDRESGEVEWNRQMFLIHGLPPEGKAPNFDQFLAERVHPDDRVPFERGRLAFTDRASFEGEIRIIHPDGSVHWIEYRSHQDRFRPTWLVIGIALDVTDRVTQRAEAETSLRAKQAAERANAAKSEFLARMSHELRTPLNAVLGFAQLIEQDGDSVPGDVQRDRVGHIRQAGEKLLSLIGDVLDRVQLEGLTNPGTLALADVGTADEVPTDARGGAAGPVHGALNVLYIEDNPVNVILVEQLVAMRADTRLHCASDGLSGVAWAAAHRPDVVLVDMQLPDIDGFEVLRRLRALRGLDRSALIALSANGISEDIALARAAGFDDYWTKPIDFRRFLSGLDRLAAAAKSVARSGREALPDPTGAV